VLTICRDNNAIQNLLEAEPQIIQEDDTYYIKIGDQKFPRLLIPIPKEHDTHLEYNWQISDVPDPCNIIHDDKGLLINFDSDATSVTNVVCDATQHGDFFIAYTINNHTTFIKKGSVSRDKLQRVGIIEGGSVCDIVAVGEHAFVVIKSASGRLQVYNQNGKPVGSLPESVKGQDARITANDTQITVVYRDNDNNNILYRTYYNGASWSDIDEVTSHCYNSFDIDYREDGEVGVAYQYDDDNRTLHYTYGPNWGANDTDTTYTTGTDAYISLDHHGNLARIAYHNNNYIDFVWYDGTSFQRHQQIHLGNRHVNLKLHFNHPVGGSLTEKAVICFYEAQYDKIYISYAYSSDYDDWTTFEVENLVDGDVTSLALCNNTIKDDHIMYIAYIHLNETLRTCHWDGSQYRIIDREGKSYLTLSPSITNSQYTALSIHGKNVHVTIQPLIDKALNDETITLCEEAAPADIHVSGVYGHLRIYYVEYFDTKYETLHNFASIYGAVVTTSTDFGKYFIPDPNEFAQQYDCHLALWSDSNYYTDTLKMMDRPDDTIWPELDYGFLFIIQSDWRHPDSHLLINHYNNKPIVISAPGPDGRPYVYVNRHM